MNLSDIDYETAECGEDRKQYLFVSYAKVNTLAGNKQIFKNKF